MDLDQTGLAAARRLMLVTWAGVPLVAIVSLLTGANIFIAVGIAAAFAVMGQIGLGADGRTGGRSRWAGVPRGRHPSRPGTAAARR